MKVNKQKQIEKRVMNEAEYILSNKSTIRDTAQYFGVSKSTVHKDLAERLSDISMIKFDQVDKLLEFNFSEKHIRGGEVTRQRYLNN